MPSSAVGWTGIGFHQDKRHSPELPPDRCRCYVQLCISRNSKLTRMLYLCRLYSKGRIIGHKRAKRNTRPNTTLVQLEGVSDKNEAQFYLGKVRYTAADKMNPNSYSDPSVLPTFTGRRGRSRARMYE